MREKVTRASLIVLVSGKIQSLDSAESVASEVLHCNLLPMLKAKPEATPMLYLTPIKTHRAGSDDEVARHLDDLLRGSEIETRSFRIVAQPDVQLTNEDIRDDTHLEDSGNVKLLQAIVHALRKMPVAPRPTPTAAPSPAPPAPLTLAWSFSRDHLVLGRRGHWTRSRTSAKPEKSERTSALKSEKSREGLRSRVQL